MGNNMHHDQRKDQTKQSPGQYGSGGKHADQQNQPKQNQSARSGNPSSQNDKHRSGSSGQ